jgi:hypothetical protein
LKTIKAMPQLDKTGPMGQGSQTGRKQGTCNGQSDATVENAPRGRRMGRGFRNLRNQDTELTPRFGRGQGKGRGFGMGRGRNSEL